MRFYFFLVSILFLLGFSNAFAGQPRLKLALHGTCEYQLKHGDGFSMHTPFAPFSVSSHGENFYVLKTNNAVDPVSFFVHLLYQGPVFNGERFALVVTRAADDSSYSSVVTGHSSVWLNISVFKDGSRVIRGNNGKNYSFLKEQNNTIAFDLDYEMPRRLAKNHKVSVKFALDLEHSRPSLVLTSED